jgi:hypothetical protein
MNDAVEFADAHIAPGQKPKIVIRMVAKTR